MNIATLRQYKDRIIALSRRNDISNIRVFGSVARGEAREDSDIDILVTVGPDVGWEFVGFKLALEELLGAKVDVVSDRSVNKYLREHVLKEAIPL